MRILPILMFFLVSCGQTQIPIKNVRTAPPNSGPPQYFFEGTFPGVAELEQGLPRTIEVIGHVRVPEPGTPQLTFTDLPEGAVFDGTTLSWTPPCGDFPDFYKRNVGVHQMIVTLKSSLDDEQFIQQKMALIVHKYKVFSDRKCGEPYP